MANTMKFGNGQWATQKDSILAFNDENANFKPLPFTASRASTATVVNKAGLLETVASGIPRVDYLSNTSGAYLLEPQSRNLITQSEAFSNSYWTKSGSSIEGDASTAGAEVIAGTLALTDGSGWDFNFGSVTFSGAGASFNANDDRLVESTILTIGQLYYCEANVTTNTATSFNIDNNGSPIYKSITGTGVQSFYFTASSAGFRITQVGAGNVVVASLSVKEVQGFASPSADTTLGAFKLVEGTSNGQHKLQKANLTVSATSNTVSYFIKKAERNKVLVEFGGGGGGTAGFDLSLGAIISESGVTAKIELISSDWYRCSVTFTTTATSVYTSVYTLNDSNSNSYQGDGTSGFYIFGAQLEAQSYPTSYILTAGSQITRLADTASQTVPDGVINSSEGVLYLDFSMFEQSPQTRVVLSDGSSNNRLLLGIGTNGSGRLDVELVNANGTNIGFNEFFTNLDFTKRNKIALSYKNLDLKLYVNGSLASTNSTGNTFPINTLSRIDLANYNNSGYRFKGNIKSIQVYNTALTDAELVKLTTI